MTVIYSFTTETSYIPTTDEWPCAAISSAYMPGILTFPRVSASRGSPYFSIDGNGDLVIYSDDSSPSRLHIDLPVSEEATLQMTFKPAALPHLFDQTAVFFIGLYNRQGYCCCVKLSHMGMAIADSPSGAAIVLPGSQELFSEGETYYTLRLVLSDEVIHIYLTRTDQLSTTGHQLRFTAAALPSPSGIEDGLLIEILGNSERRITGKFDEIYVDCLRAKIPNRRPIADAGSDKTANLGSAVAFDGGNSYDPEGASLTYRWALADTPDGSRYKVTGVGGYTTDDEGDADGFTKVFKTGDGAFSAANAPLLQPGDHLVVDGVFYEISSDRWEFNPQIGKYERGSSWNDNEVVITGELLPDNLSGVPWTLLHSSSFFSSTRIVDPYAVPDVAGVYIVRLVVNDGELDSFPATAYLNVSQTSIPLGCVPEVSWIWRTIPDSWKLVEDRSIIDTFWSGLAQAAATKLLDAWQVDYNKSFLDIQRTIQKRWLRYSTLLSEATPAKAVTKIIRSAIHSGPITNGVTFTDSNNTLQLVVDSSDIQTVVFPLGHLSPEEIATTINEALSGLDIASVTIETVTDGGGSMREDKYLKLEHPTLLRIRPAGTANAVLGFSTTEYEVNVLKGRHGGIASAGKTTAFVITAVDSQGFFVYDPPGLDFDSEGIGEDDLLIWDGKPYRILKTAYSSPYKRALVLKDPLPDSNPPARKSWSIPSTVVSETIDFEKELVQPGDGARFELKNLQTGAVFEVLCPVVGVKGNICGFDPQPLLEVYAGAPSRFKTRFVGIKRVVSIPVDSLVLEIPQLQGKIRDPSIVWSQNKDYTIDTKLGRNCIRFREGTFSVLNPPPDTLWAEITYIDNRPTIEANFGKLVNFTIEALNTYTKDLDYLSAVQGLWWAYFGGPSVNKIRTGVQVLLGLPFSETDGIIESIDESFSPTKGRIVIRDRKNPKIVRTYYYPLKAGIGVDPITGKKLTVGDSVSRFTPLCGGIEVADWFSSAWLTAYTRQGLLNELDKYFRFLVRGDVDAFGLVNLAFAIDFVKKIRPHYTYPYFVLLKNIEPSEVDTETVLSIVASKRVHDSICRVSNAHRWDDFEGSGICRHHYDEPPPQFIHDTKRLCPEVEVRVGMTYNHPGGLWRWDTIWAYDDGGGRDIVPLSGPNDPNLRVGVIRYDIDAPAGVYYRVRQL